MARGAVRFLDVRAAPPRRGRPRIVDTLSLEGMAARIAAEASAEGRMDWGEAEPDA